MSKTNLSSISSIFLAWCVHIFTASGLVVAFLAIIAIDHGDWRQGFLWLCLCLVIDGLDGTLARRFRVSEVLPMIEGQSIDYVVDFVGYLIVPAFFFYKAEMVAEHWMIPSLIIILMSSALYYGKKNMVEDEQYFIGFPVLWNIVVFFLFFVFDNHPNLNLISVIFFGILHFIPIKFAYPSRTKKFLVPHVIATIIGIGGTILVLYFYPQDKLVPKCMALFGAAYFTLFAFYDSLVESN